LSSNVFRLAFSNPQFKSPEERLCQRYFPLGSGESRRVLEALRRIRVLLVKSWPRGSSIALRHHLSAPGAGVFSGETLDVLAHRALGRMLQLPTTRRHTLHSATTHLCEEWGSTGAARERIAKRDVDVAPFHVFQESKRLQAVSAAAVGLALRYPALCNGPLDASRSWSADGRVNWLYPTRRP